MYTLHFGYHSGELALKVLFVEVSSVVILSEIVNAVVWGLNFFKEPGEKIEGCLIHFRIKDGFFQCNIKGDILKFWQWSLDFYYSSSVSSHRSSIRSCSSFSFCWSLCISLGCFRLWLFFYSWHSFILLCLTFLWLWINFKEMSII